MAESSADDKDIKLPSAGELQKAEARADAAVTEATAALVEAKTPEQAAKAQEELSDAAFWHNQIRWLLEDRCDAECQLYLATQEPLTQEGKPVAEETKPAAEKPAAEKPAAETTTAEKPAASSVTEAKVPDAKVSDQDVGKQTGAPGERRGFWRSFLHGRA